MRIQMRTGIFTYPRESRIFGLGARLRLAFMALAVAAVSFASAPADAQCTSPNPNDWPASAKPYFMIIMDTSGSMARCLNSNNTSGCTGYAQDSCGYGMTRNDHGRCAVRNTVQAFSEANFGLTTFQGTPNASCGASSADCNGANILVPMQRQGDPSNVPEILKYVNDDCSDGELWAAGGTPIGETLKAVEEYFEGSSSPLSSSDPLCRAVNVILVTDGKPECDGENASTMAGNLLSGVTRGGQDMARSDLRHQLRGRRRGTGRQHCQCGRDRGGVCRKQRGNAVGDASQHHR